MNFGEKLKKLRQEKNISQDKLAKEIFVSRSAVAKWENGLGIPNEESLKLLAQYFQISEEELLKNKDQEKLLVTKNKTIQDQKKIILGFSVGSMIGLLLLGYILIEPLREYISMLAIGIIIVLLGVFNLQGNIASIHWYNRRKVAKENQIPYSRLHGFGSLSIGITMIMSSIVQAFGYITIGGGILSVGTILGLSIMLYAQFKYNKGIF